MFKRVLVANRGLIQASCVRAVKELGARALTVFEEEDRDSAGVRNADEAHRLTVRDGGRRPYLDAEQLVGLAQRLEVDAVHPGYGFLAQNAAFGEALERSGVKLIGSLGRGGDKVRIREAAMEAGLSVLPGTEGGTEAEPLRQKGSDLQLPVMLKPVHGFGGLGLRRIHEWPELPHALEVARAAARNFQFNSEAAYLESFVGGARHVEFPVLRDKSGRTIVFPEIDASLQRRHQKLLVETPAAGMDPVMRERLQSDIRLLCGRLDLRGYASIEFLLRDGEAWFMEINQYIQPAHTATSLVTGVDLLKEQIRLASGEFLHVGQADAQADAVVVGAYVLAEDPEAGFAPSPGRVDRLYLPFGEDICLQTSIFSGAKVSPHYDPMVAKLLSKGNDREEAVRKLEMAVEEFFVEGVRTNLPFLRGVLKTHEFAQGGLNTDYLEDAKAPQRLLRLIRSDEEEQIAALVAALALHRDGDTLQRVEAAEQAEGHSVFNAATRWLKKGRRGL